MKKINNRNEQLNKMIKVSEQTVDKLKEIGKMSETYNDVLYKLIEIYNHEIKNKRTKVV